MASSLEELLAEEGFKTGKMKKGQRAILQSKGVSMPLYLIQEQNQVVSRTRTKTERTRSAVARYSTGEDLRRIERVKGVQPSSSRLKNESSTEGFHEGYGKKEYSYLPKSERSIVNSSEDSPGVEVPGEWRQNHVPESERCKDIFLNEAHESERMMGSSSRGVKERYKERDRKDIEVEEWHNNNLYTHTGKTSFHDSRSFEDFQHNDHIDNEPSEPNLDEAAIRAIISILCGYIRCFIKRKDFRTSLNHNCSSCVSSIELEQESDVESKVIANLKQAMETVERVVEESGRAKDLKKASLLLSFITGLNSKDLEDGFTSRTPKSILSACAHIYLSVIYKLQKKDKLSAKHLLQVFCNSPFHARTSLLPGLWDHFFLPNLSHLKMWYDQEVQIMPNTPSRPRKLGLLKKVYNGILDSGTYQFAVYYRDWLTEGIENPTIPSIHIPSTLVREISQDPSHGYSFGLSNPVSPQPMVNKKLYDAIFSPSNGGVNEMEDAVEAKNVHNCTRNSDGSIEKDEQSENYSTQTGVDLLETAEEAWRLHKMGAPKVGDVKDELGDDPILHTTPGNLHKLQAAPYTKGNELNLKRLAKSIFKLQQTDSVEINDATTLASNSKYMSMPDYALSLRQSNMRLCLQGEMQRTEFHGNNGYFDEGLSSIPKEFVCPITGQLFEDPVTLETGQTFERKAIQEWLNQRKRTCPVTGKILECLEVPTTNFLLKRIIGGWKSEHYRSLMAFASHIVGSSVEHGSKPMDEKAVSILEQLLTVLNKEERIIFAKHLISLGGLQFLLQRFDMGKLEQKAHIAALLSCCIEADGTCRNYLVKNIKSQNLLELLHSNQIKSRTNAVLLLIELVCLNRRKEITSFLYDLQREGTMNMMHVLLVHLQNSQPEQRPLIAVLLLHFDLLVDPQKYSIYREEAVDKITAALDCCFTEEKVQAVCCRVLLILGGHFSFSGKALTMDWLLKQAGFDGGCDSNSINNDEEGMKVDENISFEEEKAREEWLKSLTESLLGDGKKSFLASISKCLGSENLELMRVCLTTVTWMSRALAFPSDEKFQLSAFSILIPRLKKILEYGERVEHKVLASMCLLNFCKISECKLLLVKNADELAVPLRSLVPVTRTAKQLHSIIFGEDM